MVHSEHILLAFLQLKIYIKKCLTIYRLYRFFFQNYPCQRQRFLNVHLNNEVVLVPFWFPPVNGGLADLFFLFNMHKNGVFGADFEVINTRFYHWEVLWNEAQRAAYRAPEYNVPPFWGIGQGGHFCLLIGPKNTNLEEDVEILLPVKFRWIPFSGFRGEVKNVSANQRPGRPSFFFRLARKTQTW